MNLSDQVVSLDIAKRLKELGVKQESLFTYYRFKGFVPEMGDSWSVVVENEEHWKGVYEDKCSAYTVAELGEMLPECYMTRHRLQGDWECGQEWTESLEGTGHRKRYPSNPVCMFEETEANSRGKMLIHLLEQGLIKASDL